MAGLTRAVLHIDDEESDVFLVRRAFNHAQPDVTVFDVSTGHAAIDYLSGNHVYSNRESYPLPALVLLDLRLPGITGFEVLSWIRRQPALRDLPVIVLSSSNNALDRARAKDLGATGYLVKSPFFEDLIRETAALLGEPVIPRS
jgi:CheY-like chemotaxis protein